MHAKCICIYIYIYIYVLYVRAAGVTDFTLVSFIAVMPVLTAAHGVGGRCTSLFFHLVVYRRKTRAKQRVTEQTFLDHQQYEDYLHYLKLTKDHHRRNLKTENLNPSISLSSEIAVNVFGQLNDKNMTITIHFYQQIKN